MRPGIDFLSFHTLYRHVRLVRFACHGQCETLKPRLTGFEKKKTRLFCSLIKEALTWGYTYYVPSLNFKTLCFTCFEEQAMSLSVFHYNCICTCLCHFPASTHLCVICHHFICLCVFCCHFFCLMSLLQGMLKKGDFRVSAFGKKSPGNACLPQDYLLIFIQFPAGGPWMVSLWYNLQREVRAGVWV